MSDIVNTLKVWLVKRHSTCLPLSPSPTGLPEPIEPAPIVFRIVYVTQGEADSGDLDRAWSSLNERYASICVKLPASDGVPFQTVLLFTWKTSGPISYRANGRGFQSIDADEYIAAVPGQQMKWESEIHQGRLGFFLIGSPRQSNLWRVARVETDYAYRFIFTLAPVIRPNGLPSPIFEFLADDEIRHEVEQHWRDLETALEHHAHRAMVASAKNVAEGLLYFGIRDHLNGNRADMGTMLPTLKRLLSDKIAVKLPFSELDFHLMSKLRLLHQRTHVERGISSPLRPDMAIGAIHDLAEILRSTGLAQ